MNETEKSNPIQEIRYFSLKNQGGFTVKIGCKYAGETRAEEESSNILLGQTKTMDIGEMKVPGGSIVRLHANVKSGKDKTAKQEFIYQSTSNATASYVISGTTLDNELGFLEVK